MTVHAGVEAHTFGRRLRSDGCLEHYPRIYSSMLLANVSFVYALLSIGYRPQNRARFIWCGFYTTYGHFNVSRYGTSQVALETSQATFVIGEASHLFGMVYSPFVVLLDGSGMNR